MSTPTLVDWALFGVRTHEFGMSGQWETFANFYSHHGLVSNCVAYHFWPQNDQQRHMCSVNCDENALEPWCNYGDDPKVNNPWKWCSCAHIECIKDWGKILPDKNAKCYRWDHQQSAPYFSAECKMQEGGNTTWPNGNAS